MRLSVVTAAGCGEFAANVLELDRTRHQLLAPEGLAASLRRAASFLCPATRRQIVDAVLDVVCPLRPSAPPAREVLHGLIDSLISVGDLIEIATDTGRPTRLLFLGPPCYVERAPGRYLITGVRPYGVPLVELGADATVWFDSHLRTLELNAAEAGDVLKAAGLHRIDRERWAAEPERLTAGELVDRIGSRLATARAAGAVPEFAVLDPATRVTFYTGRWRGVVPQDLGVYIGRRPQEYGNRLWCAVRVENGRLKTLIDFPLEDVTVPGHDEAWRVQAAIDASRGAPQRYRLTDPKDDRGLSIIDFFSPLPSWAQRYLYLTGFPVKPSPAALFSYEIPTVMASEIQQFFIRALWMSPMNERTAE